MRDGPQRRLSTEELMFMNCGTGEDSWESLDRKPIKPLNPKGNQPWRFIGRSVAEVLILKPLEGKNWLIGKDPDAGKIEGRRVRGRQRMKYLDSIVDSMDMSLGKLWEIVKDMVCCRPWGCKESDTTELLNWTKPLVPLCNYGLHSSHHSHSHRFFQ